MAATRSHEFECGCKCGMKKSWVFVVVEMFIEVGTSWGLVEEIDGDEMKPSLMAEITTVVCGVTNRELWF